MSERPALRALAARAGILEGYHSAQDGHWVTPPDSTREALLLAMGLDASSEGAAERALAELEAERPAPEVAPEAALERGTSVEEILGERVAFGIWANLYSVRSDPNWGFGHFGDLADLVGRSGEEGAAFVGLNPLHALSPDAVCPYLPVSRLFRHPLYLDPHRIPELAHCPAAQQRIASADFQVERGRLNAAQRLDAGAVHALLEPVLADLYRGFALGSTGTERRRAFDAYRAEQGEALDDFASFAALADHFAASGHGRDWRGWPRAFRTPRSDAVRSFRSAEAAAVERHAWVQFELDRQLGEVAGLARESGLAIGLYTDLALGSDPGGSDAWAFPELLVRGVRVGAPPDAFSPAGQEWGFPPMDPAALRSNGFDFWARLLRAGFRHAGALRLDHAMAMNRLFWIPEGRPPTEGAYVRYPENELLDIVARESRRHRAIVIGEDLGTLPEGFSERLAERGILSSRVLLFERDAGGFRPADRTPRHCLATANTHDLPPLAALAGEQDLELRRQAGHLPDDAALQRARSERAAERRELAERLRAEGWLDADPTGPDALAAAVTGFLCSSPAVLVGLALDDLSGEREPINLPGVPQERHASWTRRLGAPLERLWDAPLARSCLRAVPEGRRLPRPPQPAS